MAVLEKQFSSHLYSINLEGRIADKTHNYLEDRFHNLFWARKMPLAHCYSDVKLVSVMNSSPDTLDTYGWIHLSKLAVYSETIKATEGL